MAFSDPNFEARRRQLLGGNSAASPSTARVAGFANADFEQRRQAILSRPTQQQPSTTTVQPVKQEPVKPINIFDAGKNVISRTFSALSDAVGNATNLFVQKPVISPIPEPGTDPKEKRTGNKIVSNVFDYLSTSLFPMSEARIQKEKDWLVKHWDSPVTKGLAFIQKQAEEDFKNRPEVFGFTKGVTQLAIGGSKSFSDYWNQEELLPKDTLGKARMTLGSIAESVASMYLGGRGLEAINATQKLLPIMFATIGQLTADEKTTITQRLQLLPKDLIAGWLFTKIPASDKLLSWKTAIGTAEAGTINYASDAIGKIIEGLDPKTAAKAAMSSFVVGSLFHVANVVTAQLTNAKFLQKEQIFTPDEMFSQAMNVTDTKARAEFNKIALEAQSRGMNVKFSVTTVRESPAAKVVGKGVVEQLTGKPQEIKLTNGEGKSYIAKVEYVEPGATLPASSTAITPTEPKPSVNPQAIQTTFFRNITDYTSAKDLATGEFGQPETAQIGFMKPTDIVARDPIDPVQVAKVKADIAEGKPIEPIIVSREEGKLTTVDGSQRLTAFQEAGKDVPVIYTGKDAISGLTTFGEAYKAATEAQKTDTQKYDYKSTQLDLPEEVAGKVQAIAKDIPETVLYKDPEGKTPTIETDSHVTVLYGLGADVTKAQVEEAVGTPGPITVTLGKTSVFENPDKPYDVLKIDVESPELRALNEKINKALGAPGATFKEYKPHITVAYLDKGKAAAFAGNTSLEGTTVTLPDLTFSDITGEKITIPLSSKKIEGTEYRGAHTAPTSEENAPLSSLTDNGIYPDDIYSANAPRLYSSGFAYDKKAFDIVHKAKGHPEMEITIYRSVPKEVPDIIRSGDWVAITKEYAQQHGESNLKDFKVISKKVKAGEIYTDGNSIQEWGYNPGTKSEDGTPSTTPEKPVEPITAPSTKITLTKEGEEAANTVLDAISSGDPDGARALYDTFVEDGTILPPFDELTGEIEAQQKNQLTEITNELKAEIKGVADEPTVVLLGIADKLMKHFNGPGALFKITGKRRTYKTPEGEITVGGDLASAFDRLVFATDVEGFKWNVRALHYKFDRVFTELRDIMDKGDIDGADYEQFKNSIAQYIAKRPIYTAGRGTTGKVQPQEGKQQSPEPRITAARAPQVTETLGFNPKNLEDPTTPTAEREAEKLVKRSEIAKTLSEKLGVPIRRGKFRLPGAIGVYKTRPKVIRIKSGGLQTIFHEVGHFLDDQFKLSGSINPKERKALMQEYGASYEGQAEKQRKEAFAEFLRFRMTGQTEKIKERAPEFFKVFEDRIAELPEVKAVIDTATADFKRWNEQPATAKILSHISIGPQNKASLGSRIVSGLHDLYTASLDDLHPLSEFSNLAKEKLGTVAAEKDPYILARNLRGWTGKAELFLTRGTFGKEFWTVDAKGKSHMNFTGPSYEEIMKPLKTDKRMDDFRVYIVAKRAIELDDRGIKTGIARKDATEAMRELEEKNPDFLEISEKRLAYKNALLDYAAAPTSGVIGKDGLARIKELNKYHVPFYRVMEEMPGKGFMGRRKFAGNLSSPIKKIKGSEREIIDPLESDVKDTYAIINAVERNSIGIAMANLAKEHFELGRLFEEVQAPMKAIKVNAKEVMDKVMKEAGADIELPEDLAELTATIFRPTQDRGPNMLNVNMGDKQKVFQVDPELFKAIQGLNAEDAGVIMRIISMPSKLLRAGATLTPDFSLRNPLRDQFSAFIYSRYGFIPGFDLMRGMFHTFAKTETYDLWKAGGGEHAMMVSMDRDYLQKELKELLKGKGTQLGYFTKNYIKNPLGLLQLLSEFGEKGTRLGEMRRALDRGATPTEAAFASREVTLDFARTGAKTKAVNMLIAFWNANVQGSDKMIRSFREFPYRTLLKVLMGITLPSILLYFANRQDERWKEIPRWQKDLFWIVFTKNHIIRIPKPFEVGVLFGSVPERILEYVDTNDPKIFEQLIGSIASGATPGFIPTFMLPIIENISNYSFFLDRPIVSEAKQGLPQEAQYNTYTSELAKLVGRALNYSPAKVDNLIQGYTAGLGNYAVQAIDKVLIGTGLAKPAPKPAMTLESMPVVRAFMVREPIGTGSESVNRLYTMYEQIGGQISYVKKLMKEGNEKAALDFIKAHPEIANVSYVNGAIDTFSDINRAREQIMNAKNISPAEKTKKIRQLDIVQTTVAQRVLRAMNGETNR